MRALSAARDRRGLTLVEVMVALVITGLVASSAYAILTFAVDRWSRAQADRVRGLAISTARETVAGWIRTAAVIEDQETFVGLPDPSGGFRDEIHFLTRDAGPLRPGPHRVRLWVAGPEAGSAAGLLAELAPVQPGRARVTDTLRLAPDVGGMATRYLSRRWDRPEWNRAWASDTALPEAVEIHLLPTPTSGPGWGAAPLAGIPLLVPLHRTR